MSLADRKLLESPKSQRETIYRTSDGDDKFFIWSAKGSKQATKLLKRLEPVRQDVNGYWFEMPTTWMHIHPPRKITMTDEQREAAKIRLMRRTSHVQEEKVDAAD